MDADAAIPGARRLRLTVGALTFTAWEMGQGPLVLLLHGFPDSPLTFHHQLPALAAAGYRAVAVTLRGYERSSQLSGGAYRIADLAADVFGWMDALGVRQAHIVGHDWGATIGYAAAAFAPDRVLSLSAIAVPHPARFAEIMKTDRDQLRRSSYILFFQVRGLADWWVGWRGAKFVERIWRKWSPGWRPAGAHLQDVRERFSDREVRRAALGYYRLAVDRSPAAMASRALVASPILVRTLGINGEQDGCISPTVFECAMRPVDFPGGLSMLRLAETGHFCHVEAFAEVNEALVAWLGQPTSTGSRP